MDINEGQNVEQENNPTPEREQVVSRERPLGPTVGVIIVVVLLILGGLYFWGSQLFNNSSPKEIRSGDDAVTENLSAQGTSDNVSAIEGDLRATDLDSLDADLENIEAEFSL